MEKVNTIYIYTYHVSMVRSNFLFIYINYNMCMYIITWTSECRCANPTKIQNVSVILLRRLWHGV